MGYDARTRQKRIRVNGVEPARAAEAIGIVRGVVLSPSDGLLVAGGPRERRHYLDVLLALTVRGYVEALTRYRRALAQRSRASAGEMAAWEDVLAECGAAIVAARRAWAERWAGRFIELCGAIGERGTEAPWHRGTEGPAMRYRPSVGGDAATLRRALEGSRASDRERGRTSVGPHRDELQLTLGGRELRVYGSAGQHRTAALALRLLEVATLDDAGGPALLALDDAFAELDDERVRRLGAVIERHAKEGHQVVAAVPKAGDVPSAVAGLTVWRIQDGRVQEREESGG